MPKIAAPSTWLDTPMTGHSTLVRRTTTRSGTRKILISVRLFGRFIPALL